MPSKKLNVIDMHYIMRLAHLEFGHWVVSLGDALIAHAGYQGEGTIPPPLRNGVQLKDLGTGFLIANAAAETKHVDRVKERDDMRPAVELQAAATAQWTVIRSVVENNPSLTANLPLPYKKPATKTTTAFVATAPRNPRAKHGPPNTVLISTDKVDKARTYDVRLCAAGEDLNQESSWSILGPFDHCRNIEISGLEAGKLYYFQVRCFAGGVYSAWSEMVTIRVL